MLFFSKNINMIDPVVEQWKGRTFFWNQIHTYFFNYVLEVSKEEAGIKVTNETNPWDVKIYRNYLGICQPWPYESEYVHCVANV